MNGGGQSVDVTTLPVQDLNKIRTSLAEDVQLITNNFGNLKVAQSRYTMALEALSDIKPENANKRIMVPLTGSLYVPGQISDVSKVMVDIGTGYYAEKPVEDARSFLEGKLKMLSDNISKVGAALSSKRRDYEVVTEILQEKMAVMKMQQQKEMEKINKVIV